MFADLLLVASAMGGRLVEAAVIMAGISVFTLIFLAAVLFAGSLYLLGLSRFLYQIMVLMAYSVYHLAEAFKDDLADRRA